MILIQSSINDLSTNDVLDWIFFTEKEQDVSRINNETTIQNISFKVSNTNGFSAEISTDKGKINSRDIQRFWYRRGNFSNRTPAFSISDIQLKKLIFQLQDNFQRENERIIDNMYSGLEKGGRINRFQENFTSKIHNLSRASAAGLKIPENISNEQNG